MQFKFPPPGILAGIKSNTRAIMRMTNCSYTYPGAKKPSLTDASLSLTLSSRVAIIGGNGAGKSTFIKMLTGETIPQAGKVEKHPNLRIGYIKQHALELHVREQCGLGLCVLHLVLFGLCHVRTLFKSIGNFQHLETFSCCFLSTH